MNVRPIALIIALQTYGGRVFKQYNIGYEYRDLITYRSVRFSKEFFSVRRH